MSSGKVVHRSAEKEEVIHLRRQLGLLHGIAIVSGLVIGGGIYISPKGVAMYSGSTGLCLILWGVGGFLSLIGALTYAEMGVVFPVAGEKYAYLEKMYGPFVAFLYIWQYIFLNRAGGNAVKALMFARYVLKPFFPDCEIPSVAISLIATCMTGFLTFVNCFSVKLSARWQSALTTISMTTLAIISLSGAVWIYQGNTEHLKTGFDGSTTNIGSLALAVYSTVYAYYGWTALNFLIEELKRPERNLPLSIVISILLTTLLYVFVNLTYISVIGLDGILQSEAVAISVTFKSLGRVSWVVPILIAISACGSFNAGIMCGSRMAFAGSRNGHLPYIFALINIKFLTPITSIILQGIIVTGFIWAVEVYSLINNLVCGMLVFDAIVVIGYIRYRIINRELIKDRAFKLPLAVPICYFILMLLLVGVPLVTNPKESIVGVVLSVGTAIPYYVIVILWLNKSKNGALQRKIDRFNHVIQKFFYCVPEEKAS